MVTASNAVAKTRARFIGQLLPDRIGETIDPGLGESTAAMLFRSRFDPRQQCFDLVGGQALRDLAVVAKNPSVIISTADPTTVQQLGGVAVVRTREGFLLYPGPMWLPLRHFPEDVNPDEFAALLPWEQEEVEDRLTQLLTRVRTLQWREFEESITLSAGGARYPDDAALLDRADECLYQSKRQGRDCWHLSPTQDPPKGEVVTVSV